MITARWPGTRRRRLVRRATPLSYKRSRYVPKHFPRCKFLRLMTLTLCLDRQSLFADVRNRVRGLTKEVTMRIRGALIAAGFLTACLGTAAQADTYDFGTIGDSTTFTSNTINHKTSGSYTDYFTFNTTELLAEFTTGAFTESAPFGITSADLTLYAGMIGSGMEIATSGIFDPMTMVTPTVAGRDLAPGDYYIKSDVVVPSGSMGSYTVTATTQVSAAPEPGTWALMLLGLGLVGFSLRTARSPRRKNLTLA